MVLALLRFVELLRAQGVRTSPGEVLDAVRGVEAVGLEDRQRFRAVLRASLVKNRRHLEAFDRLFETFFAPPARAPRERGKRSGGAAGGAPPAGAGQTPTHRPPDGRPRPQAARDPREPRRHRGQRPPRPGAPQGDEERLRAVLQAAREGDLRRRGRLRRAQSDRDTAHGRERGPAEETDPLRRDLTRAMPSEEERRLSRMVPRLIEEIRLRPSRRMRRARQGHLWARQVFRENLSRGGVPFVLPMRRPRVRRARVVLLVDVSWSAARATGYFLWMAASFLRLGRAARVLLFVDRPVDATRAVERWARRAVPPGPGREGPGSRSVSKRAGRPGQGIEPRGLSFDDLLESIPDLNLQAPSDYGRTFHALLTSRLRPAGRGTVLVVLGDGRTNRFDPLPWAFEDLSRRCGAVLWLVPEPEARWGTADSALAHYLPHTDSVVESTDLAGLVRGLTALLRRV